MILPTNYKNEIIAMSAPSPVLSCNCPDQYEAILCALGESYNAVNFRCLRVDVAYPKSVLCLFRAASDMIKGAHEANV